MTTCKHPPRRLFSGHAWSPRTGKKEMWVACCDCGEVLTPSPVEQEEHAPARSRSKAA